MTHMDEYTILYQAKERMIKEEGLYELLKAEDKGNLDETIEAIIEDEKAIRTLALKGLEQGIYRIRREFPPNVSKRMYQYYSLHKESLISTFSPRIHEAMQTYYKTSK